MCSSQETDDAPVLVVVMNDPQDLLRARDAGWYRIPLDRAPARIGAEYLAFYQTAAFPPAERWGVRWLAPIRAYHIVERRQLIPEEPAHPRAHNLYYRVDLGPCEALDPPVPSRSLRRITFIQTTLGRLRSADEINDLWIKSSAQERLWVALKAAQIPAERQYPLSEDLPAYVADFALIEPGGRAALMVTDEPHTEAGLREVPVPAYVLAAGGWRELCATRAEIGGDPGGWAARLAAAVQASQPVNAQEPR